MNDGNWNIIGIGLLSSSQHVKCYLCCTQFSLSQNPSNTLCATNDMYDVRTVGPRLSGKHKNGGNTSVIWFKKEKKSSFF